MRRITTTIPLLLAIWNNMNGPHRIGSSFYYCLEDLGSSETPVNLLLVRAKESDNCKRFLYDAGRTAGIGVATLAAFQQTQLTSLASLLAVIRLKEDATVTFSSLLEIIGALISVMFSGTVGRGRNVKGRFVK